MTGVENGVVLLSARERKALFRAIQDTNSNHLLLSEEHYEALLDGLDDGGLWNPCFLVLPNDENALIALISLMPSDLTDERSHTLRALRERCLYVAKRRDGPKSPGERWPFVKTDGYYGPNWDEKREAAIQHYDQECVRCGRSRSQQKLKYGHDLHVHHKTPLSNCDTYEEANQLQNLMPLCLECHRILDPNLYPG